SPGCFAILSYKMKSILCISCKRSDPSSSLNYPTPYGIKTPCPQTYNLASQSGAETGLFSHQGPVVNTKMEPYCPPRKLSPRFVAKIQNRLNCGALYFP